MAYLTGEFRKLDLEYVPSSANFILVRVGRGARVYDGLLRQGVIVRPMDGYGFPHHLRITVGQPEENARCIAALAAVLRGNPG
jgi:histidinol-phosphate aminotransferase